jgi:hypothetical protein
MIGIVKKKLDQIYIKFFVKIKKSVKITFNLIAMV